MKYAFAASMIAALAAAQAPTNSTDISVEDLFELNDEGRYELQLPELDLPEISFVDTGDRADVWKQDTRAAYEAIDQQWVDAWKSYEAAITEPWNNFVTEAERIQRSRDQLDIQTTEDVVNFIANNTFVDGRSLQDTYPEIQEFLAQMVAESNAQSEAFNLDQIRIPTAMRAMRKQVNGQVVFKRVPLKLQVGDATYEGPSTIDDDFYPAEDVSSVVEEIAGKVEEALVSYGYDEQVVNEWLETAGANWEALDAEQEQVRAQLAQQQTQQAADYVRNILENAFADLKAREQEAAAQMQQEIDAKAAEMNAQIDSCVQDTLAKIEARLQQIDSEVQQGISDMTSVQMISMQSTTGIIEGVPTPDPADLEPTPLEIFSQKARAALESYGFDQAEVEAWLTDVDQTWSDLDREQQIARGELAQQQALEASNYVKGILDRAIPDLRAKDEAANEQLKQDIDAKVVEIKAELDRAVQEGWDNIEQTTEDVHNQVQDYLNQDVEEAINATMLASKKEQTSGSFTGFGLMAGAAVVATAAYLYKKGQEKDIEKRENLLSSEDTEFVLV